MSAAPSVALSELAAAINAEHRAVRTAYCDAVDRALRVGAMLVQAKDDLQHGAWLPWLKANCPEISERTAQAYMKLHREHDRLPKSATVADLTFRDAMRELAFTTAKLSKLSEPERAVEISETQRIPLFKAAYRAAAFEHHAHLERSKPAVPDDPCVADLDVADLDVGELEYDPLKDPDREVKIVHLDSGYTRVTIGPNEVARRIDCWEWMGLCRQMRHDPSLAALRENLQILSHRAASVRAEYHRQIEPLERDCRDADRALQVAAERLADKRFGPYRGGIFRLVRAEAAE